MSPLSPWGVSVRIGRAHARKRRQLARELAFALEMLDFERDWAQRSRRPKPPPPPMPPLPRDEGGPSEATSLIVLALTLAGIVAFVVAGLLGAFGP